VKGVRVALSPDGSGVLIRARDRRGRALRLERPVERHALEHLQAGARLRVRFSDGVRTEVAVP
jgi:hypothetical protein